jgi:hypothetical protein
MSDDLCSIAQYFEIEAMTCEREYSARGEFEIETPEHVAAYSQA